MSRSAMASRTGMQIVAMSAVSIFASSAHAQEAPARVELAAILSVPTVAAASAAPSAGVSVDRGNGALVVGADRVQGPARYARRSSDVEGAADVSFSRIPEARVLGKGGTLVGGSPRGLPLASSYLTSSFGYRQHPIHGGTRMHSGVDLAAPMGTPVRATADGVVASAGWRGGYGILVSLGHGAGLSTRYAHLSAVAVSPGSTVKAGQVVGYVGATGSATGPHVHYEVRINGRAVNPMGS